MPSAANLATNLNFQTTLPRLTYVSMYASTYVQISSYLFMGVVDENNTK